MRHRGTLGGSLAHGDPASDLPAVGARARRRRSSSRGRGGERAIAADRLLPGLPRDRARARRDAHRDPGARRPAARAGRSRSSTGGPRTGRSSASPRSAATHPGVALVNMGSTPLRAAAVEAALRAARRPPTPPRSRPTAPSRRPTSTRRPSTAATWRGCSSARARHRRQQETPDDHHLRCRLARRRARAAGRRPHAAARRGHLRRQPRPRRRAAPRVRALADGARARSRASTRATRARCPASSPCTPPTDLDVPDVHRHDAAQPAAIARHALARDGCASSATPSRSSSPRRKAQAVDAAEAVIVDYDPLPAVVDLEAALAPDAPLQFEALGSNLVDGASRARRPTTRSTAPTSIVRGALREPAHRGGADGGQRDRGRPGRRRRRPRPHRVPRVPDAARIRGARRRRCSASSPSGVRRRSRRTSAARSAPSTGLAEEHRRGPRRAASCDRPVKWVETRSENMIAMPHGRGQVQYVELGLQARRHDRRPARAASSATPARTRGFGGMLAIGPTRMMAQGVYRIPKIGYDVAVALTNTTPMGAYRGAGRPEAAAMLERIIDMAADELGIDPVEMRRRNFLQPDEFPYTTVTGATYDSRRLRRRARPRRCASPATTSCAPSRRRAASAATVKQLGIGVCALRRDHRGRRRRRVRRGRGPRRRHAPPSRPARPRTARATPPRSRMIVADRARHPDRARSRFVQSDTALGAARRRHRRVALAAARRERGARGVRRACSTQAQGARRRAARGDARRHRRRRRRPPRRRRRAGARRSRGPSSRPRPATTGEPLAVAARLRAGRARRSRSARTSRWSRSTPRPGGSTPIRHVAVDDCGRILNPLLVDGQQHGGIAQGIAQALWEECVYDDDGNPLTSTLADYAMPSAAELPSFEAAQHRDADAAQPARRQGHRRVGHDRLDARGAERGGRRAQPPRRPPHRHAVHARAGVARDRGRPGRHAPRPVARAARPCSPR